MSDIGWEVGLYTIIPSLYLVGLHLYLRLLLFKKERIPMWIMERELYPQLKAIHGPYIFDDIIVMIVFLTRFSLARVCPNWWGFVSGANSINIQVIRNLKLPSGPIMVVMEIGPKRLVMDIICYLTHTFERPPTQYGQSMHSKQTFSWLCGYLRLKCGTHFKTPTKVLIVEKMKCLL